jgi:hypothetical protein
MMDESRPVTPGRYELILGCGTCDMANFRVTRP